MGWWKVQGTQNTIGDEPLDALGAAVTAVIAHYQTAFQRSPTRAEWGDLLFGSLGAAELSGELVASDGAITKVTVE
jgi:hypothetical protein